MNLQANTAYTHPHLGWSNTITFSGLRGWVYISPTLESSGKIHKAHTFHVGSMTFDSPLRLSLVPLTAWQGKPWPALTNESLRLPPL